VMKCNADSNKRGNINEAQFLLFEGTNIGLQSQSLLLPFHFLNFHWQFDRRAGNRRFNLLRLVSVCRAPKTPSCCFR
jgi:hypothetical protein